MFNGGFKQKLSVRTQIALHRLIADVKEVANDNDPDQGLTADEDLAVLVQG